MKLNNSTLFQVRQLDKKIKPFGALRESMPTLGWINLVRSTLGMSLTQLSKKMSKTPQSLKEMEQREKDGGITLKSLKEAAEALDMQLVYGFIPKEGTLEKSVERKANEVARKIVLRTSVSMKLEDQGNSNERVQQAIKELTEELKREVPKSLWD